MLAHTAGFAMELDPALVPVDPEQDWPELDWPRLREVCLASVPEAPAGTRVQYGNPHYGLLAIVVERLTGLEYPAALERLVLEPLHVEAYLGTEPLLPPVRIAEPRGRHVGTAGEPFNSASWRGLGFPWGGLVTSAAGALALVRAFRPGRTGLLSAEVLAEATRNQTNGLAGGQYGPLIWDPCPWGLGAELRGRKEPHWTPLEASPESFGHAGASGSVAWYDPDRDVAWALLGTRAAFSGWLLRQGANVGRAVLEEAGRGQ
jgi:CubicO group peptidase (beta-lactamase class C family)